MSGDVMMVVFGTDMVKFPSTEDLIYDSTTPFWKNWTEDDTEFAATETPQLFAFCAIIFFVFSCVENTLIILLVFP